MVCFEEAFDGRGCAFFGEGIWPYLLRPWKYAEVCGRAVRAANAEDIGTGFLDALLRLTCVGLDDGLSPRGESGSASSRRGTVFRTEA